MISQEAVDFVIGTLSSWYLWAVSNAAISAEGFTISWFELWISFSAVMIIIHILLGPLLLWIKGRDDKG